MAATESNYFQTQARDGYLVLVWANGRPEIGPARYATDTKQEAPLCSRLRAEELEAMSWIVTNCLSIRKLVAFGCWPSDRNRIDNQFV